MLKLLLVLLVLCVSVRVSAGETKEDFETFISSLPRDILKDQISVQTSLFELLNSYKENKAELFPYEHFHPNEHYGDYGEYHALEAEVNIGVVFVGFPDNSIPRIRDLFFNDLERRDHLHIGEEQAKHVHVTASPGSAMINHQFHVVDTSFHADEAIRRYMRQLLRPQHQLAVDDSATSASRSKYYLNVWELEEALESLNWHMQHHLNEDNKLKKKRPSLTMYVLNLDLDLELDVNIDQDLNINPELDIDPKSFRSGFHNKHSYSYLNGYSPRDLDQIRRNTTCLELAKKLLKEKNDNFDTSRKVFEHDSATHIPSLHREYSSIEELEASVTPPPEPVSAEDEAWNQHYSDYGYEENEENKEAEPVVDEHFRLNEVHASKAWARGRSDDFLLKPEAMTLEARVLRILQTTDPLSSFSKYRYDLARDLVQGRPENLDTGGETDNPGISWVGSGDVAWLDLGAKAQTLESVTPYEGGGGVDGLLSLGETLNYQEMSRVNAEERGGRDDGSVYGNDVGSAGGGGGGGTQVSTVFPHKAELYALRHSLHQHHIHCGRVLLHTRRKEIEHDVAPSEESLAHEDVLYRLSTLPDLQSSGAIAPTYHRDVRKIHFNTQTFIDNFNNVRSSINEGIEANHLSKFSAILYLQQALISASLELSVRLELAEDEIVARDMSIADGMKEYYFELMEFHNQVLAEAIEVSNMFVGKGHFSRKGFTSHAIHTALATVGSSVLELTRLLLSKPVTVMPHFPQLKTHLATQELLRRNIEMAVRAEKLSLSDAVPPLTTNAYTLLKDLKEDALATAVFRGMQKEHQEALLAQAHLAQASASEGGGDYGGYDDDYGSRYGSYGRGYGGGYRSREMYGGEEGGGAKQYAEVLMTAAAMTPPLLVPKYIEIEVYVVKMQESYYPLVERERKGDFVINSVKFDARASFFGDENGLGHALGFDMSTFMSEVQRLKLPNQQMSITVHTLEGADEPTLYLGLAGCRRYRTDEKESTGAGVSPDGWVTNHTVSYYYSADCVWRHLQHADSVEHAEAEAAQRNNKGDTGTPDLPDTQHVAMFLLSVDSLSPHYLDSQEDDELHQAVTFGDSILLLQNKQVTIPCTHASSMSPPSPSSSSSASDSLSSASSRARIRRHVATSWQGRNPLRAALEAMSRVILGMGALSQHTSLSKHSHTKTHLTPLRVSAVHYSDLELVRKRLGSWSEKGDDLMYIAATAAIRNRILRSVDFAGALDELTSRDISSVGHEYTPEQYVYLHSFTSKAILELDNLSWEKAAVLSNMIVKIAWSKRHHFDAYVHRQKILNNDKQSFDFLEVSDSGGGMYGGDYPYGGGYMGDDMDYHRIYAHDEDGDGGGGDAEEDKLAAQSIVWICILLACKTCFVACLAGGLSYAFFFTFSRVFKNLFYNKSQLL